MKGAGKRQTHGFASPPYTAHMFVRDTAGQGLPLPSFPESIMNVRAPRVFCGGRRTTCTCLMTAPVQLVSVSSGEVAVTHCNTLGDVGHVVEKRHYCDFGMVQGAHYCSLHVVSEAFN
jgi:hypothetical protein